MDKEGLNELLSRCRNNDRLSQGVVYERFYSYALSVALPYCAHEEEAREVVNDAFLKVFTGLKGYDPAYAFATWVRTIVVRTAINRYKSRKSELIIYDLTEGLDVPVEDDFLSKMAAEDVLQLVQNLPPAYRLVINLFALEGFSHAEIAEMLEISVGTSKSNLSKAKAKLKQMLTDHLPKKYG
ncbi:MAG: sigma-70 family RNA polymerase sigma factor [Thermoanaerobaculia bacterium]|nr:sigma-70 family RNA polymerase sigma factor [Thermoanaerobaculia bacterium]